LKKLKNSMRIVNLIQTYFLILLIIGVASKVNGQSNCENFNSLLNEFSSANTSVKNLELGLKIKYLNYVIDQQQWKINSKGSFTLPYSKSIESIVQPDGNVLYTPRNYVTPIANITTTKKIAATGGEIGVTGGIDFFRNFVNNNRQFNANWINFYVSQPLFIYNQFKFDKIKQRLDLSFDSISYYVEKESKTKAFVEKLLDFETKALQIEEANSNISIANNAIEKIRILVENGRALGIDTIMLAINKNEIVAKRQNLEQSLVLARTIISNYINRPLNAPLCSSLEMPAYILDSNILIPAYLKCNFSKELILDSFIAYENIKKAKKARGIVTSINAGLGANQSASNLGQLFTSPSQRQNISIGTAIPITGWDNYLRKKEVALLDREIFENNRSELLLNATVWYLQQLDTYNVLLKSYQQVTAKGNALLNIAAIQLEKVVAGKATSIDYNSTITQIANSNIELIEIIKKVRLFRFEIRSYTLIDILDNKPVY
jgi:hypothetical protein